MTAEIRTYSTRLTLPVVADEALKAYASLFGKATRSAYAARERAVRAGAELTKAQRKAVVMAGFL